MNQLSLRDVEQHVNILGWLLVIGHALFLGVGVFVFFLLTGIGAATGDDQARAVLVVVGTTVGLLLALLALPGMLAGYGLLRGAGWGRALAIVISVFNLANFPVGTAIGLYGLWVLLQVAANDYFADRQAGRVPAPGPMPSH